jgi:hypothetical protein
MLEQKGIKGFQNFRRPHSRADLHTERFTGVLIKHSQHLVGAPIAELVVNEVYAPNVIGDIEA